MEYLFSSSLIILFILFLVLTIFLKNKFLIKLIIYSIAIVLLVWKTIEFTYYGITNTGTYPIEFSHISYFVYGVIILSGIKKFYFTAGIYGFLSGIGYIIGGVASPKTMLTSLPPYLVIMGYISHMFLLLGGLLTLFKVKRYPLKDIYITYIFLALTFIFAYLVKIKVFYSDANNLNSLIIMKLIDGSILQYLGIISDKLWIKIFTSCLTYFIIALLVFVINKTNNIVNKRLIYIV